MTVNDNGISPKNTVRNTDAVYLDVLKEPFKIYGVKYDKILGRFVRMDSEVAADVSAGVKMLNDNTSGGRVKFVTDSKTVCISADMDNTLLLPHIPLCAQSGFDLYKGKTFVGTFMPKMNIKSGYAACLSLDGELSEYTINFPLYDNVKSLFIGLSKGSTLKSAEDYKYNKPVAFYGSSITQGASCSHPGNCYVSRVCRRLDTDYINLGFAANCKGEQKMAEYVASLPLSALVIDFDHNCKNAEELNRLHYPFYKTVRTLKKDLPILLLSAPDIINKGGEFIKRREVVENTYKKALAEGDKNIFFIGGENLFDGDSPDGATVDGTHPNDLGFYRMANVIEKTLKQILER